MGPDGAKERTRCLILPLGPHSLCPAPLPAPPGKDCNSSASRARASPSTGPFTGHVNQRPSSCHSPFVPSPPSCCRCEMPLLPSLSPLSHRRPARPAASSELIGAAINYLPQNWGVGLRKRGPDKDFAVPGSWRSLKAAWRDPARAPAPLPLTPLCDGGWVTWI